MSAYYSRWLCRVPLARVGGTDLNISRDTIEISLNFIEELYRDKTRENLKRLLWDICRMAGLEGFTWWYGTHDVHEQIDTRPSEWMKHYEDKGLLLLDPIVREAVLGLKDFQWSSALAKRNTSRQSMHVMGEASEFGMKDGVHFPVGTLDGKWGCLSFYCEKEEAATDAWLRYRLLLKQIAFYCMQFSEDIGMADQKYQPLSPTEKDALILLMHNLTRDQAAAHMGVSRATLDDKVSAILRKFQSRNLVNAAIKARNQLNFE